jgi:hypothetical protein
LDLCRTGGENLLVTAPQATQESAQPSRRRPSAWREALVVTLGLLAAFWSSFWYARQHPLHVNFHQGLMGSALYYACTGVFGRPDPSPEQLEAYKSAALEIRNFVLMRQLDYSCASFPKVAMRGFFSGLEISHAQFPLYLLILFGQIWRTFGVHWAATYYVIGLTGALTFLSIYFCGRAFMPRLAAAGVALIFLCNPVVLSQLLRPRDSLKVPFFIVVTALLIGAGTRLRRRGRFILFACAVGFLIGVGYGFRPDMLFMLVPAAIVIGVLGQVDLAGITAHRRLAGVSTRLLAVGGLVLSFMLAGLPPLWNDYVAHPYDKDRGFHIMAMGLEGTHNYSLLQSNAPNGEMYMYRDDSGGDLPIIMRVEEYGWRRYGAVSEFGIDNPYWLYARRYYLDVVRLIPADLLSRGIGAFVSLMTLPASMMYHPLQAETFNPFAPWSGAFDFARDSYLYRTVVLPLDRLYQTVAGWPSGALFAANLMVMFGILCLVCARFGIRALLASIVLFGAMILVTSLDFEMRHMFYLYAFVLVAWASVLWWGIRALLRLRPAQRGDAGGTSFAGVRMAMPAVRAVALTLAVVVVATVAALKVARVYQVATLHGLIADWLGRTRVTADYAVSELPEGALDGRTIPPHMSGITVRSPMPPSSGGVHAAAAPQQGPVEMGVVAVEFDGRACAGRTITLHGVTEADVPDRYILPETFNVQLHEQTNYIAFLPSFHSDGPMKITMKWIELPTADVACINSVSYVSEFKKSDVIFDYFVPADLEYLRRSDLFQRVYVPGLGFI